MERDLDCVVGDTTRAGLLAAVVRSQTDPYATDLPHEVNSPELQLHFSSVHQSILRAPNSQRSTDLLRVQADQSELTLQRRANLL